MSEANVFLTEAATGEAGRRKAEGREGLTWAATGHRPDKLGGYDDDTLERFVALACRFFTEVNPSKVITGMALGWDTAVALACVRCNIPFVAAIPFEGQEKRWPEAARARYRMLRNWASEVVVISQGGDFSAAMHARNKWMVDRCDQIVALWNGDPRGGTAHCLGYAKTIGRPFVNLWNSTLDGVASLR